MTPVVVWFYINTLFFPYNAQDLAKVPFEEYSRPILENLGKIEEILPTPAVPTENQQMQSDLLSQSECAESHAGPQERLSQPQAQEQTYSGPPDLPKLIQHL